jgi:hypothetical protein
MSPRPGRLSTGPRHGGRTSEHGWCACRRTFRTDEGHEEVVGDVAACPHRSRVAAGGVGQRQMAVHRRSRQSAHLVLPVPHPPLRHDRARSGDVLYLLLGSAQKEWSAARRVRCHFHPRPFQIPAVDGRRAVHAHSGGRAVRTPSGIGRPVRRPPRIMEVPQVQGHARAVASQPGNTVHRKPDCMVTHCSGWAMNSSGL